MAETMNAEMKKLARHALGFDRPSRTAPRQSYRNRHVTYTAHPVWDQMVKRGWACFEVNTYVLRREGAELALEPGEWLDPEDFPLPASPEA